MKIRLLSIAFMALGLFCGNVKADNVDILSAKQIGAYYFSVATGAKNPISTDDLKLAQQFDNPTLCIPAMYAFNVAGNGFIVVSASDATEPVLAYSPEGNLDPESINPACQYLLDSYAKLISDNQNNNAIPTAQVKRLWKELEAKTFTCDLSKAASLIQTKWDQGENTNPSYNCFCPQVNGLYSYAGCVAVAMGQIIKYWNYPEQGGNDNSSIASCPWNGQTLKYKFKVDSNRFLYDSMPNQISYSSEWSAKRAIGKLLYACGVTVKMGWDPEGSGAQSSDVPGALSTWFKYSDQALYKPRTSISDANWVTILREEIVDHQRPVYYSGYDNTSGGRDAGHAWVVCGISSADNNKFYINWGWGGSSNGFYTLAPASSIGTAGGYKFTAGHAMVYKIFPKELGINDNTTYATTRAYPNPATSYIMIPSDLSMNAYLSVYSADGKMIDTQIIPGGTKEYRLDLQNYAPGMYIYRLNGETFKFTVK